MRLKLLYNPAAGRGRARRHIGEAIAYLRAQGASVDCTESRSPEHLSESAAKASRQEFDRIVVCGGDGTLHYALRDLDLSRATLGILPLGSGDDFAGSIGIPKSIPEACQLLLGGSVREVDVGIVNDRRFLGVAGLGFDSEVARHANEVRGLQGPLLYLYSILRVLPRFRPRRIRLTVDGQTREEEIMFAVVGNSPRYGGGIRIAPAAVIDDGWLDLCLVTKASRLDLLLTLPLAYSGNHGRRPYVQMARGKDFLFESDSPLEVFADGEPVTSTPARISLSPERLRVAAEAAPTSPLDRE